MASVARHLVDLVAYATPRRPALPRRDLLDRWVPAADAVLLGHTHFDHVLDAPAIVQQHGCAVYGSASVATRSSVGSAILNASADTMRATRSNSSMRMGSLMVL